MKLPLCTVATTLAVGVNAIASHSLGVQGHESLSLLNLFRGHPSPVAEHDVGPMLKSAESMLMGLAVNHEDAPLHDLVTQIRPFIAQMQDSINAAHASAQQTLTNFGNDFSGCNSAKATGEAEASALESTKNNQSNQHKSCRTRQKTALDQLEGCQSTLNALQGAKNSSCQLYEDAKLQPGCGGIPPNANEEWESYVSRAATWFTTTNAQFISKKNVCQNDTANLEAQKTVCLGADGSGGQKKAYFDVKQDCDHLQASLETTTCSYVSKVDATCNSSATCTNTLADSFDAQKTGIETLEHQRKVEWNATERLLCLLDVYGSSGGVDATKLQTCQHIADNTSHLNLVYPTPTPRPSPCADLLPHPCTADYITQEYGGLDADTPAETCTPCSFAQPPPPRWDQGSLWSEDFDSTPAGWTQEVTIPFYSNWHCGSECHGGSGCCWRFTRCRDNLEGEVFANARIPANCTSASRCTLSYAYKGKVVAGIDQDGIKGGQSTVFPHTDSELPPSTGWVTVKRTGLEGWHLMFETYNNQNCVSYLDNIAISLE